MTDDRRANAAAQAVPRTEAGKRLLDEWAWMRAGHGPNTAKVRDLIVAAEAEAASLVTAPLDLDVETLARQIASIFVDIEHSPGVLVADDESLSDVARKVAARLRAAASATAHSAPPSEALTGAEIAYIEGEGAARAHQFDRAVRDLQAITTAPPSEALRVAWTDKLALIIAKSRFGPGLDMGGKHNPRPSERIAARQFVEDFAAALASSDRDASPATPDARPLDRNWLGQWMTDALDRCNARDNYGLPRQPADLGWMLAEELIAANLVRAATPDASALRTIVRRWENGLGGDAAMGYVRAALASGDTEPTE